MNLFIIIYESEIAAQFSEKHNTMTIGTSAMAIVHRNIKRKTWIVVVKCHLTDTKWNHFKVTLAVWWSWYTAMNDIDFAFLFHFKQWTFSTTLSQSMVYFNSLVMFQYTLVDMVSDILIIGVFITDINDVCFSELNIWNVKPLL